MGPKRALKKDKTLPKGQRTKELSAQTRLTISALIAKKRSFGTDQEMVTGNCNANQTHIFILVFPTNRVHVSSFQEQKQKLQ